MSSPTPESGSSAPVPAALSPSEWNAILASREQLEQLREGLLDTPFSPHGIAALMLYQQDFGLGLQDVIDEVEVAAYCDKMAGDNDVAGNTPVAETFRLLGMRHRLRAAKIAALLPPLDMLKAKAMEGSPAPSE
jgi:hypothetical protein